MTMLIPCVGGKQIILAQPDVFDALVSIALQSVIPSCTTSPRDLILLTDSMHLNAL